jgi:hypothetical protein
MVLRDRWHVVSSAIAKQQRVRVRQGQVEHRADAKTLFWCSVCLSTLRRKTHSLDSYLKIQDVKFGCGERNDE